MKQGHQGKLMSVGLNEAQRADLAALIARRTQTLRRELAVACSLGSPGQMQVTATSDADRSVADVDADLALASLRRDEQELEQLNRARERIGDGSYGSCVQCGQTIEYRRLLAAPAAMRCLKCQSAYEKQHGQAPASL